MIFYMVIAVMIPYGLAKMMTGLMAVKEKTGFGAIKVLTCSIFLLVTT